MADTEWVTVPREPTPEMREAAASFGGPGKGYSAQHGDEAVASYRHMIAAAPPPPTRDDSEAVRLLRELVSLKTLKDGHMSYDDTLEYQTRQPVAWAAARAFLAAHNSRATALARAVVLPELPKPTHRVWPYQWNEEALRAYATAAVLADRGALSHRTMTAIVRDAMPKRKEPKR